MTRLADLSWPEVRPDLLVVPLGSTEQHGPHLPFSTDTDIAVALAERLAAARPGVVVAPALPYGASGEHAGFPGTLSIGQEALAVVLVELVRSASLSFPRVLLLNGHGGNLPALRGAVEQLRHEGHVVRHFCPRWRGDAHAGRTETSVQLALAPARVGSRREPGNTATLTALMPQLVGGGVRPVSPNGVLGDPTGANADEGRRLLEVAAADLLAEVASW